MKDLSLFLSGCSLILSGIALINNSYTPGYEWAVFIGIGALALSPYAFWRAFK